MANDQTDVGICISRGMMIAALAVSMAIPALLGIGYLIGRSSRETVVRHQLDFGDTSATSDPEAEETLEKLSKIKGSLELFALSTKSLPTTADGLSLLREREWRAIIAASWQGISDTTHDMLVDRSLSDSDLLDGWGQPFRYASPRKGHKSRYSADKLTLSVSSYYDLWSVGKDGVDGTADDISK